MKKIQKNYSLIILALLLNFNLNAQVTIDSVRHGDALRGSRTGGNNLVTNGDFEGPTQSMIYWGGSNNNNNTTPGNVLGTNACGSNRYGIPTGTVSGWNNSGGGADSYPRVDTSANSYSFAVAPTGNGGHNVYFGNAGTYEFANSTDKLTYNASTGLVSLNGNSFVKKGMFVGDNYGTTPVTLSQTITVTPGTQYLLDFFVSGEDANCGDPAPPGIFQFEIGNQVMYGITGGNQSSVYHGASERYYVYFKSSTNSVTISFKNWGHIWLNQSSTDLINVFPTYAYSGCINGSPNSWCPFLTSELVLDDVVMNAFIPLPLNIYNFKARKENEKTVLTWFASDELEVENFKIMYSEDGINYKLLSKVKAGNGSYSITDNLIHKGITFFKLVAENRQNNISEHGVISLSYNTLNNVKNITLIPNPATDLLKVSLNKEVSLALITIVDMDGKIVYKNDFEGSIQYINTSEFASGLYTVNVTCADFSEVIKLSIIK